jgi:hypothetical protein
MPNQTPRRIPTKRRTLGGKIVNFSKAAVQHLAAGCPQATDEQVAERFAICQGCELFKPKAEGSGTCQHPSCGCSLKAVGVTGLNKLRWADQKCPIDKWQAVTPQER